MSTYFIGDIHGCYKNLKNILEFVNFDSNTDFLFFTGDLVARGPSSLEVLRLIYSLKETALTVLGNHDLYLLKMYFSNSYYKKNDNSLNSILSAPDVDELIDWLRKQPILYINKNNKILMAHAGINPVWNINEAKLNAQEIEKILISDKPELLFFDLSKTKTQKISNSINIEKLKNIQDNVISFTKMRYINADGKLDLSYKNCPKYAPIEKIPWFNLSKIKTTSGYSIIFGHWSSLKNTKTPSGIYGLDSGCCWGRNLTLLRWEDKKIISQPCNPPN